MAESIYQKLVDIGATIDHHESDLYVLVEPKVTDLFKCEGLMPGVFTSTRDGKRWYELSFQYLPFWEKKSR